MPYIHWEAYIAQRNVSSMIEEVENESLKTNPTPNDKLPLWPSERRDTGTTPGLQITDPTGQTTHEEVKLPELDHVALDNPEAEEDYFELLRRYLFKRRPMHLRRTLDQYYYSYLTDTNDRDSDQVVMRQYNEDKKNLELAASEKYKTLIDKKGELEREVKKTNVEADLANEQILEEGDSSESRPKSTIWQRIIKKLLEYSRRKELKDVEAKLHKVDQRPYYDENSPVLMIDQLWLWVIDESL